MAVNESPGTGDDGWILAKTVQHTNSDGNIKFEIELPSGRKVESEFFNPEHARRALLTWIATIKGEQESDRAADVASARAKARELGILNRPKPRTNNPDDPLDSVAPPQRPTPSLIVTTDIPTKAASPSTIAPPASRENVGRESPDDFARNGLALARKDVDYWKGVAQGAQAEWAKAQAEVEKWERMLTAIGGGVLLGAETNRTPPTGIAVVSGVRKRGRPRGSVRKTSDSAPVRLPGDNPDVKA